MKKHNEGYTLPLVLVVMIVMCLIAVSVMSVALHNLQAQKASITRMQEKYAAQGKIEIMVAQLLTEFENLPVTVDKTNTVKESQNNVQTIIAECVDEVFVEWDSDEACTGYLTLNTTSGQIQITCTIKLENVIVKEQENNLEHYKVCVPEIIYTSYKIGGGGDA